MKVFIGCSASDYIPDKYFLDCKNFLEELFERDFDLVFGACNAGLMGMTYNVALNNNKNIIGIYPETYKNSAEKIQGNKILTPTIGLRTDLVIKESDALIFLPGGFGTVYELFTAIEFKRGCEFNKPIIIYNSCGYFDKMLEFIEITYKENFASRNVNNCYYICDSAKDAIRYIDSYYGKGGISRKKCLDD